MSESSFNDTQMLEGLRAKSRQSNLRIALVGGALSLGALLGHGIGSSGKVDSVKAVAACAEVSALMQQASPGLGGIATWGQDTTRQVIEYGVGDCANKMNISLDAQQTANAEQQVAQNLAAATPSVIGG